MASFLSPNSYSFDKFSRLQDYFMSSLGQTEGFQDRMCAANEYGMAVLHEPFYQDNQSIVPSSEEVPTDQETTTTTTTTLPVEEETTTTTTTTLPVEEETTTTTTQAVVAEQKSANNASVARNSQNVSKSPYNIPRNELAASVYASIPRTYSQNNVNRMQTEWNAQKATELAAALDSARADADKLQAEAITARETALKAEYDAQILEANTKTAKAANNLSQANTLRTLAETKLSEANAKWTEAESKLKIAQELSAALDNEKKTLLKWDNKNSNSKLAYSELSYANGNALNSKYIPVSVGPVISPAALSTKQNNSVVNLAAVASSASKVSLNQPLVKSVSVSDIPKLDPPPIIPAEYSVMSNIKTAKNALKGVVFQFVKEQKNIVKDIKKQDARIKKYNDNCVPVNKNKKCDSWKKDYDTNEKELQDDIKSITERKGQYDNADNILKAEIDKLNALAKSSNSSKSRFWDIIWRNPLEAFTVDEGLISNLPENKISASNKKPTNKPKSTTSKMANNRSNNNSNRMREAEDMETTTTMMVDEDMETTTTRKATSKKASKKANNRKSANNEDMEDETTTSTMMAEDADGEVDESTEPADESTGSADESTGSADESTGSANESTERGPDGDEEVDPSEPTEEVTEGFSGSRAYRFGHLSTALKALLLALLFWLLTNTAGSTYVAKLAKRVGASTCVVQVIVFFVLAYIALML
jgi:hypothetical protein